MVTQSRKSSNEITDPRLLDRLRECSIIPILPAVRSAEVIPTCYARRVFAVRFGLFLKTIPPLSLRV